MSWLHPLHLRRAAASILSGGVIAYPTEGVFGLGCNPLDGDAVRHLLFLKQRSPAKGLILVASDWHQVAPFLAPGQPTRQDLPARPYPVTWLLPASGRYPWLTGDSDRQAVRISDHPQVKALCRLTGLALVSTSANRAGKAAATDRLSVRRAFGSELDYILPGRLGNSCGPSEIRDAVTGKVLRPYQENS